MGDEFESYLWGLRMPDFSRTMGDLHLLLKWHEWFEFAINASCPVTVALFRTQHFANTPSSQFASRNPASSWTTTPLCMLIARRHRISNLCMSKRQLASASASPRKKRNASSSANANNGQPNLDSFFKVRTSASALVRSTSGTPKASSSGNDELQAQTPPSNESNDVTHSLADDEALARRLAEEDGIDIDLLHRMETQMRNKSDTRKIGASSTGPKEVIDVDLLDEQCSSPSRSQATNSSTVAHGITGDGDRKPDAQPSVYTPSSPTKFAMKAQAGSEQSEANIHYPSLSSDPLAYPLDSCPWPINASAPYSFLAHTLATLSGTKSRIAIYNTLTNCLRTIIRYQSASLCSALYLLSNSLSPPYSPLELGLGPSIISKAIQDVSGLTSAALKRLYNATGDPGTYTQQICRCDPIQ